MKRPLFMVIVILIITIIVFLLIFVYPFSQASNNAISSTSPGFVNESPIKTPILDTSTIKYASKYEATSIANKYLKSIGIESATLIDIREMNSGPAAHALMSYVIRYRVRSGELRIVIDAYSGRIAGSYYVSVYDPHSNTYVYPLNFYCNVSSEHEIDTKWIINIVLNTLKKWNYTHLEDIELYVKKINRESYGYRITLAIKEIYGYPVVNLLASFPAGFVVDYNPCLNITGVLIPSMYFFYIEEGLIRLNKTIDSDTAISIAINELRKHGMDIKEYTIISMNESLLPVDINCDHLDDVIDLGYTIELSILTENGEKTQKIYVDAVNGIVLPLHCYG